MLNSKELEGYIASLENDIAELEYDHEQLKSIQKSIVSAQVCQLICIVGLGLMYIFQF